jgi:hypothetical protein
MSTPLGRGRHRHQSKRRTSATISSADTSNLKQLSENPRRPFRARFHSSPVTGFLSPMWMSSIDEEAGSDKDDEDLLTPESNGEEIDPFKILAPYYDVGSCYFIKADSRSRYPAPRASSRRKILFGATSPPKLSTFPLSKAISPEIHGISVPSSWRYSASCSLALSAYFLPFNRQSNDPLS